MTKSEIASKTKAKLSEKQLSDGTAVLNHMVAEVNQAEITKKTAILNAAQDLERIGFSIDTICHRITMRAAEMNVNSDYVRECLPSKYKNQAQREVRYSSLRNIEDIRAGRGIPDLIYSEDSKHKAIEVKTKQDIEIIDGAEAEIPSSPDLQEDQHKRPIKGSSQLREDKLPESERITNLNRKINDLKWELSFRQEVIDALTKRDMQYKKDFADNYESKFRALEGIITYLEEKNSSYNYLLVGLDGISEPGISDEMRLDTVNNFIKKHHDRISVDVQKFKQERERVQAQNAKSWK